MGCVTLEQLADLIENRSGAAQRAAVERHLVENCQRCRANWEWLQRIYSLTAVDVSVDPPDWLVRQAEDLFAKKRPATKAKPLPIMAALVFDSFHAAQYADVRKAGEEGRQLIYRAPAYDIDLRFLPAENPQFENAIGQVLGRSPDFSDVRGLSVAVYKGRRKIAQTETNAVGVFNLHQLPQGKYDLTIRLPQHEIRILGAITSGFSD